jgi:Ca-activated chloride channel family protein
MTFQPTIPLVITLITLVSLAVLCIRQIAIVDPKKYDSDKKTWVRRLVMVLCLLMVGLGPCYQTSERRSSITNLDILFVVDTTSSMSAEDMSDQPTRLDAVKTDINYLTYALPPAKYSAITFNSYAAEQVPLTDDVRAVRTWAKTITPEISSYSNGSDFSTPVSQINQTVNNIYNSNPDDHVVIMYFTDGENTSGADLPDMSPFASRLFGGAVITYGTDQGGRMKSYTPSLDSIISLGKISGNSDAGAKADASTSKTKVPSYIQDPETNTDAISHVNEAVGQLFAKQLDVQYVHRIDAETITNLAKTIYAKNWHEQPIIQNKTVWNLIVWPFALLFGILVLFELIYQTSLHIGAKGTNTLKKKEKKHD